MDDDDIWGKLQCVEILGCMYEKCPEKQHLREVLGILDAQTSSNSELVDLLENNTERISDWGHGLKICSR
jgi:hypothetical protein